MHKFSQELLSEIKRRVDLVDYIQRSGDTVLKPNGETMVGLCPFHNDTKPSFHVYHNPEPHFKCFGNGCGESGDIIDYIRKIYGVSFQEAVKEAADLAGVILDTPPKQSKKQPRKRRSKKTSPKPEKKLTQAELDRNRQLFDGMAITGRNEYLARKQIDQLYGARLFTNIRKGDFGYKNGNPDAMMSGLAVPMFDIHGALQTFQIILSGNAKQNKLNMPGPIPTGAFLFIGAVEQDKPIIIAEGFATGASIHMATGWPVAVAFGASRFTEVISLIQKHHQNRIIIAGDDDSKKDQSAKGPNSQKTAREKTEESAHWLGIGVVFPDLLGGPGNDFNDLHCNSGLDAVREQLHAASEQTISPAMKRKALTRRAKYDYQVWMDYYVHIGGASSPSAWDSITNRIIPYKALRESSEKSLFELGRVS
ncbi:CHC2 zinc finger domain-containing protein [Magnetococcales bacterium HHB-1]